MGERADRETGRRGKRKNQRAFTQGEMQRQGKGNWGGGRERGERERSKMSGLCSEEALGERKLENSEGRLCQPYPVTGRD